MKVKQLFNALTGRFDFVTDPLIEIGGTNPINPSEGQLFINSGSNDMLIYYGGQWQTLHTLTGATLYFILNEDGTLLLKEDGGKLALE